MSAYGEVVLEARGISKAFPGVKALDGVDLTLRAGRSTALLGENGAGKSTLMKILAGVQPPDSGELIVESQSVSFTNPRHALDHGIAMIYQELSLVPDLTIAENIFLGREPLWLDTVIDYSEMNRRASLHRSERFGLLNGRAEREYVEPFGERFRVKTPSLRERIRNLSGGNQQKVILAKWLATGPTVLMLDEPTRGIDVQAKNEIHELINELTGQGLAIVIVSSELPEVMTISDRILVLCEGRATEEFHRENATEEAIMHAALPGGTVPA